jgi:large subunit ribosomal protein L6
MSRIGNKPIPVPAGVKVELSDDIVKVEGAKAKLERKLPPLVSVELGDNLITVKRENDSKSARAMHGLTRSLLEGMVTGVSKGFVKKLEIVGVGYRGQVAGNKLTINLGYSHPVEYTVPDGITVTVTDNTKLSVEGADKQAVGQVAAIIRGFRKPEPYKGKGIRYEGEHIVLKEGKTVG